MGSLVGSPHGGSLRGVADDALPQPGSLAPRFAVASNIYIDHGIYKCYNPSIMSTVLAPPTISIKDAAARLGVHENTVAPELEGHGRVGTREYFVHQIGL